MEKLTGVVASFKKVVGKQGRMMREEVCSHRKVIEHQGMWWPAEEEKGCSHWAEKVVRRK